MSLFSHIIVPVDGSKPSQAAIGLAVRLAKEAGAELTFCYVLDRGRIATECTSLPYTNPTPVIESLRADGERVLKRAADEANAQGLSARIEFYEGSPIDTILTLAAAEKSDLIVMGTHGRRGIHRLFMGSTTEALLRRCPTPVLVVRGSEASAEHDPRLESDDEQLT